MSSGDGWGREEFLDTGADGSGNDGWDPSQQPPPEAGAGGGGAPGRDPVVDPLASFDDEAAESGLRPRRLDDFVGQPELKERLDIVLGAARRRE